MVTTKTEIMTSLQRLVAGGASASVVGFAFWLGIQWAEPEQEPAVAGTHQMTPATYGPWLEQASSNGFLRVRGQIEATQFNPGSDNYGDVWYINFGELRLQDHGRAVK